jgi:hypothetical protein
MSCPEISREDFLTPVNRCNKSNFQYHPTVELGMPASRPIDADKIANFGGDADPI